MSQDVFANLHQPTIDCPIVDVIAIFEELAR
jgi:hypothetical protein